VEGLVLESFVDLVPGCTAISLWVPYAWDATALVAHFLAILGGFFFCLVHVVSGVSFGFFRSFV